MSILDLSITPRVKMAPKVVGVKPFGSQLLVELLGSQELTSNRIIVGDGAETDGPPQAYVLEIGPGITCPHVLGLKGKRVLLNGKGSNVPIFDDGHRVKVLIEYNIIKGVLEEEGTAEVKTHSCCRD